MKALNTIKALIKDLFFILISDQVITLLSLFLIIMLADTIYYIKELTLNNFLITLYYFMILPLLMILNLHFKK